jgi:hypothetical protein
MKGVNFITDDKNRRTAVIIELKTIEQHQEEVEDLLDVIIAESRKDEPKRSWEQVKNHLKRKASCIVSDNYQQ